MTGEETHCSDVNEVEDVYSAATGISVPITSDEVARQIRAANDALMKLSEKLCDLMRDLRRDAGRRDEGTSAPIQGLSGPCGRKYNMVTGASVTTRSESLTGTMNPTMKQPDNITSTQQQPIRQR